VQPVRLAVDVRVRGMVRHRWRGADLAGDPVAHHAGDCAGVDRVRVPDRDDLAQLLPGIADSEMDDQGDLPDRQVRPRYAAFPSFPRPGGGGCALYPAPLGTDV